jgi:hypothetical protein
VLSPAGPSLLLQTSVICVQCVQLDPRTYKLRHKPGVTDTVPDKDPEHHVDDEDDKGGDGGDGRKDGHEDGGYPAGSENANEAHNEGQQCDTTSDRVNNECVGQALQGDFVCEVGAVGQPNAPW